MKIFAFWKLAACCPWSGSSVVSGSLWSPWQEQVKWCFGKSFHLFPTIAIESSTESHPWILIEKYWSLTDQKVRDAIIKVRIHLCYMAFQHLTVRTATSVLSCMMIIKLCGVEYPQGTQTYRPLTLPAFCLPDLRDLSSQRKNFTVGLFLCNSPLVFPWKANKKIFGFSTPTWIANRMTFYGSFLRDYIC